MALTALERDFDFFDRFFNPQLTERNNFPRESVFIDKEDNLVFMFALAGFSKDNIQITLENDILSIKGRKENKPLDAKKVFTNKIAFRDFHTKYTIPGQYVNVDKVNATFENGILIVTIEPNPKLEPTTKIIQIQ